MESSEVKNRLSELIANSVAIQGLPVQEREEREKSMLAADEETMLRFIDVLEEEVKQVEKLNETLQEDAEEINKLIAEANQLEKQAEREIRKNAEAVEREKDDLRAEELLRKLDEIVIDSKSQ
ncbi:hypothetical protein C0416_04960 [bacterium]|nr:hypothetical protein [bacterium]